VFLLFWIFDLAATFIENERFEMELTFWFYAAISSTVLYIVLKVMKKLRLLNETN